MSSYTLELVQCPYCHKIKNFDLGPAEVCVLHGQEYVKLNCCGKHFLCPTDYNTYPFFRYRGVGMEWKKPVLNVIKKHMESDLDEDTITRNVISELMELYDKNKVLREQDDIKVIVQIILGFANNKMIKLTPDIEKEIEERRFVLYD